jgi:hypothetical protein
MYILAISEVNSIINAFASNTSVDIQYYVYFETVAICLHEFELRIARTFKHGQQTVYRQR